MSGLSSVSLVPELSKGWLLNNTEATKSWQKSEMMMESNADEMGCYCPECHKRGVKTTMKIKSIGDKKVLMLVCDRCGCYAKLEDTDK